MRILIVSWLVTLVIANELGLDAKDYDCQLLPVVKKFPSRMYPEQCSLTIPTYICAGFCTSSVDPVKAKRRKDQKDIWEIQLKEDCGCCIPTNNRINTAFVRVWKLDCLDGVERNESVTIQWPSRCSCMQCRASLRLG